MTETPTALSAETLIECNRALLDLAAQVRAEVRQTIGMAEATRLKAVAIRRRAADHRQWPAAWIRTRRDLP